MNLLNTIKGLYEKVDPQDTGGAEETSMIMGQLKQIKHYIEGIEKTVAKDGDVEEWVQNKLTKATDYLKSVYGYKLGQDDSGEMDEELKLTEEIEMAIEEGKRFGLTQSLLDAVKNVLAAETKPEDKLDPVNKKAVKKDFDDRKDKDIDNDGDVDDSDEYLHKRRQAVSKAVAKEEDDGDDVNINVNVEKEEDDEDEKKEKKAKKDVDNGDKSDEKKAMAKTTDDDDEKSAEEKQKEKEYIAKKSDRKEPVDTKPMVKESLARKRLSGMMRDKANVKNVRIPTPAERRAQMQKQQQQKKEEVIVKEVHIKEAEMTPEQEKKREEIVMALKKKMPEFEAKYGDRAKEVMYATATKMAMKEHVELNEKRRTAADAVKDGYGYRVVDKETGQVIQFDYDDKSLNRRYRIDRDGKYSSYKIVKVKLDRKGMETAKKEAEKEASPGYDVVDKKTGNVMHNTPELGYAKRLAGHRKMGDERYSNYKVIDKKTGKEV